MRPDVPLDPDPRRIDVGSQIMYYTETGTGRPVVAVHGMPATSRDFRWLDSALDGRLRFLRLDLPGFGKSPAAQPPPACPASFGGTVAALCEAAELKDVVVLGHSMGGAAALDAASRSDRITSLVLVNSAGPLDHRGNFPGTYRVVTRLIDLHPLMRRALVATLKPVARRVGFSKRIHDDAFVLAARVCGRYDPGRFEEQLRDLTKPVLVAWSPLDPAIEPAVSETTLETAQRVKSLSFDAKTHNLQASQAMELADALVDWAQTTAQVPDDRPS